MFFLRQSNTKTALWAILTCCLTITPFTAGFAETQAPPEETSATLNTPATASDPNTPAASADPNEADNEDVFTPKISTLIKINQGFEAVFNDDFITEDGMVRYADLRRKRSDLLNLMRELDNLNPIVRMSLSQEEETAFWINTYNACILSLVVDNYPIEPKLIGIFYPNNSIMQLTRDWRSNSLFNIQGLQYKLEEIENEFLLDRTKDPRILFALSYASMGSAPLRNEPYTAEKLDDQLNDQIRRFLASAKGMKIDRDGKNLYLSNQFTMYGHKDFFESTNFATIRRYRGRGKASEQAWLNFIHDHVSKEALEFIESGDYDIKFMKFDWELNENK